MESTMQASVLVKKLHARQAELKKKRVSQLAQYDRDFTAWKRDVAKWVMKEVPGRVSKILKSDMQNISYGRKLPEYVFRDMPSAPRFPPDDVLRSIRSTLHMISVTGDKTITVTSRDIAAWFGTGDEEDSE